MAPDGLTGAPAAAAMALIQSERESAIAGDLATLPTLWTEDARIVDGRGTEDEADDYVWQGRDAIMDRYELAVLPAPPPPFDPAYLSDAPRRERCQTRSPRPKSASTAGP